MTSLINFKRSSPFDTASFKANILTRVKIIVSEDFYIKPKELIKLPLVIPIHNKDLKLRTLTNILKQAGLK